jgi:hypothetical protein
VIQCHPSQKFGFSFSGARINLPFPLVFESHYTVVIPQSVVPQTEVRDAMSDVQPPRTRRNQHPGYGFRLIGPPGRRRRVVDETERQVMARIVELRKLGKSWEQIAVELLQAKVVARTGREWSASRVRRAYFVEMQLASEELPGTKRCLSCGRVQSVDQYHNWLRRKTPDGLNTQCRECRRQKRRLTHQRARETKTKRLMTALKRGVWSAKARRSRAIARF